LKINDTQSGDIKGSNYLRDTSHAACGFLAQSLAMLQVVVVVVVVDASNPNLAQTLSTHAYHSLVEAQN
jgi:hypothetical protein